MYCPKCGKENQEDARFCMHCGADLSGYKVEVAPKIEVSPKISVSAKAESGVALKWKLKPIKYAKIEGVGKLPVYEEDTLAELEDKHFCPLCGNYASLKKLKEIEGVYKVIEKGEEKEVYAIYNLYHCLACDKKLLECIDEWIASTEFERNFEFKGEKIPAYKNVIFTHNFEDRLKSAGFIFWQETEQDAFAYEFSKDPLYNVAFCPICKRDRGVKPVETYSWKEKHYVDEDENTYVINIRGHSNTVKGLGLEPSYNLSLWECELCGKFLVYFTSHPGGRSYTYGFAYPMCEFCDNSGGRHVCSVCGKRICKDCAVTRVIKKRRLLPDKTIILCPNCAKEK